MCGELFFARITPHDGGTTFGRDYGVDCILHHQHAIGDRNGQSATASAFAGDRSDDWNLQPRHFTQISGDCFRLAAFLGAQAGVSARSIDKRKYRPAEFLCYLHRAECFPIALGIGHPEIAVNLLLGIARLLMPHNHDFFAMETRHPADDGRIVGIAAIAMNLAPLSKNAFDVIERIGALRMPCQFGLFPGCKMRGHLFAQGFYALMKLADLCTSGVVLPSIRLQLSELLLNFLQFPMLSLTRFDFATATILGGPAGFHHRQEKIGAGNHQRSVVRRCRFYVFRPRNFHLQISVDDSNSASPT